jgi:aminomethyltransferase|tara:strand:- start:101973 stop:102998 length:1026 start_codon:yes stop_codon:yes gene_type:complete
MVPFAGWEMPVQYSSILEEHRAVREGVGLFDVSHMGEVHVTGVESEAFLNYLLTNDISRLKPGFALYTVMCHPSGGVVDDLLVYRFGAEDFLLVVNAGNADKDWAWIQKHAANFECEVENQSDRYALLALQGPKAAEVLEKLTPLANDLPRLTISEAEIAGITTLVARSGYTGEDGFEIFIPIENTEAVATEILSAGETFGLKLIGLGARDSLRLEAGYPLYGHELSDDISPLTAGLKWVVKLNKPDDFIGKDALAEELEAGSTERIVWFTTEGRRIPRMDTPVLSNGIEVGRILSGTLSPIINAPIGSALISVEANPTSLEVDLRGTRIALLTKRPPLHK